MSRRRPGRRVRRGGFTLLELMLVMSALLFAILAMSESLVGSMKLNESNRETELATDGAREMVEILQGSEDFAALFATYNADPSDDPGGYGKAPGNAFSVDDLSAVADDPDGFVGEIVFPTLGLELREDAADDGFDGPRDLNGDGAIDSLDHSGDYRILPVLLRLRWKGSGPASSLEVRTLIADR